METLESTPFKPLLQIDSPAKTKDVVVKVSMNSELTAEEEFFTLVIIISFICLALIFLLIGLVIKFRLQKREYKRVTYEQNILYRKGSFEDMVRLTDEDREVLEGRRSMKSLAAVSLMTSGASLAAQQYLKK